MPLDVLCMQDVYDYFDLTHISSDEGRFWLERCGGMAPGLSFRTDGPFSGLAWYGVAWPHAGIFW